MTLVNTGTVTESKSQKVNNFISRHNVITATICIIIGSVINELVNEFFDGVIVRVINDKNDKNDKNKEHKKKFEEYEVVVLKKKIRVGKLLLLVLKLFIIIIIVIILDKILENAL